MLTVEDLASCSLEEIVERIKSGERAGNNWDSPNYNPIQDFIDVFWTPIDENSPFLARHQNEFVSKMTGLSQEEIE